MAFKIATAPIQTTVSAKTSTAPSVLDGFIFNILNPKAYAAFLAIFSQFLLPFSEVTTAYLMTGAVCLCVAAVVDFIWLYFGNILRPIFASPKYARALRVTFAILMVGAVVWTLI